MTGGVRKIRISKCGDDSGKSSGMRACFAYFEEYSVVLLLVAYGKNEQDNISAAGKKAMKALVQEVKGILERGT